MAIDNKHAISRADGVRTDNDHEYYGYYKDDVPQAAEGGHAGDSPWPSAASGRTTTMSAMATTRTMYLRLLKEATPATRHGHRQRTRDVGLEPYEHDFVLL
jgi:hypothetical protein